MEYNVTNIKDIITPGKTKCYFKITISGDHFRLNDVITNNSGTNCKLLIITQPVRKWYKLLLQFITFKLYKAPWEYKAQKQTTFTK